MGSFPDTITEFLSRSQQAGMKRIVIDLQQNSGGDALLAFDTFKQVKTSYIIPNVVNLLLTYKSFSQQSIPLEEVGCALKPWRT